MSQGARALAKCTGRSGPSRLKALCFFPPLQIRVGTSGQGMFATWHLRTVEVVHIATGDRWVFNCHGWIDKKTSWCRVLVGARA